MKESVSNLVVHTDLDATLLDHDTYSWKPAEEAINLLKERNIPLILNSSKTLAEMKVISAELELNHPLVCENGSLIAFPESGHFSKKSLFEHFSHVETTDGYILCHLGVARQQFLNTLHSLREEHPEYSFKGYADWDVDTVSDHTGLPSDSATLSHKRFGTEPIHWHGTDEAFNNFQHELKSHKLKAVGGGRFIHISGLSDKANGLLELKVLYQNARESQDVTTIALGDSPNDLGMLSAADIAVVIPNHTPLSPTAHRVIFAEHCGPEGWNDSMKEILASL